MHVRIHLPHHVLVYSHPRLLIILASGSEAGTPFVQHPRKWYQRGGDETEEADRPGTGQSFDHFAPPVSAFSRKGCIGVGSTDFAI